MFKFQHKHIKEGCDEQMSVTVEGCSAHMEISGTGLMLSNPFVRLQDELPLKEQEQMTCMSRLGKLESVAYLTKTKWNGCILHHMTYSN